jgi:hypothetical protein
MVHSRKKQLRICELKEQEKSNDTNRIFCLLAMVEALAPVECR